MGIILDLSHPIVWLFRHVWSDKAEFSFLQKKTVLHWLPVKFRICHKIAVISFKTIHNMGPTFLSDLINIKQCSRYNLRSFVGVISQDSTAKFICTLDSATCVGFLVLVIDIDDILLIREPLR